MVERIEDLFIEEKQNKIIKYIDKVEKVTIQNIMNLLKVSRSTVRRYLIDLERKNLIIRTRGGALKKKYFKYEFSLNEKKDLNLGKKQKIARIARRFIDEGDIVYISGGTTTFEFAKLLYDINDLVVFTNAFKIVIPLSMPAIMTLIIVNALWVWNELLIAIIFLQKSELRTLMVGLTVFRGRYKVDQPVVMASLLLASIPMILLYLFGQRFFVRGMMSGSLKGE